jgi:hypothetical protein
VSRPRPRALAALVVVVLVLHAAPVARAGTATLYQCTGPGGAPVATDLLTPGAGEPAVQLTGVCGNPAPGWDLRWGSTTLPGTIWVDGQARELRIDAPVDTVIVGGRLERQMVDLETRWSGGRNSYGLAYRLSTADGSQIERCGGLNLGGPETCQTQADGKKEFPAASVELPPLRTAALRLGYGCATITPIYCFHFNGTEGVGLGQLALRVFDEHAPTVVSVAGALAGDTVVRRRELALNASDRGLGLYRVQLHVDGRLLETQPFDRDANSCRDLDASSDGIELSSGHACPTASTSRTLSFARLPLDGEHAVRVVVQDASGNQTVALDRTARFELPADELRCPSTGCVFVRPPPNGTNASPQARLSVSGRRTMRAQYGRRVTIAGRLSDPRGAPIAAAQLDVTSQARRPGAAWRPVGQVHTDARGGFRYVLGAGPSRVVRIGYRAHLGDAEPAQTLDVRVEVTAGVRLALRPGTVRPGGAVKVTGRLLGAGVARGTFVELQALDGREWRTFKTLAVGRRGRFAYRYRFRHTSGAARFLWRVHVRAQAGLPYGAASSRAAWVTVRR